MSNFIKALNHTLPREGGYVNDPQDPGGETNYGITKRVAREFGYKGSMKNIPMDVVKEIYHKKYWLAQNLDKISLYNQDVAVELFDAGVNCGIHRSSSWFQRSVNLLNRNEARWPDLRVDGDIGNRSLMALNNLGRGDDVVLLSLLRGYRAKHYIEITEKRGVFEKYIRGWIKRI